MYLAGKGYRRCAFIGESGEPPYSIHPNDQRLKGFQAGLEEAGLHLPNEYIIRHPFSLRWAMEATRELLELREPPEVVFTYSDLQAVGVLKAARQKGLTVPDDLGVLGFDNLDLADYMELTTIDQSLEDSGRTAVELLMARMSDHTRPIQKIMLNLNIIERSTA